MSNTNDNLKNNIEDSYDKYISDLKAKQQSDSDYGSYEDYLNNSRSKSNNDGVDSSDVVSDKSSDSDTSGADSSEVDVSDKRQGNNSESDAIETDHGNNTESMESSTGHNSKLLSDGGNGPSEIGKGSLFQNASGAVTGATGALKGLFGGMLGGGLSAIKGLFKSLGGKVKSTASQLGMPVQAVVAVFSLVTGISAASLFAMFGGSPDFHITSDPMDDCIMEQYKWKQNQEYKPLANNDGSAKAIYEMLASSSVKFNNEAIAGMLSNGMAESSLSASCFEMDYLAGSGEGSDMTLARTHHRNWDVYCSQMFDLYSAKGLSINEDAYKYNEIVGTYEQRVGKDSGGTVVGTHYYPGIGIFQWTGPRAYHLQEFSDTLDNPVDNNLDGHNDAMYTMKCQLAFLLEENYWTGSLSTFSDYDTLTEWGTGRKFSYSTKWYVNLPSGKISSKVPIKSGSTWYFPYVEVTSKDENSQNTKKVTVNGDNAVISDNVTEMYWDEDYREEWLRLKNVEEAAFAAWKEAYRLTYLDPNGHDVYGNRYHNALYWNFHNGYGCHINSHVTEICNKCGSTHKVVSTCIPCNGTHQHILYGPNKCDLEKCEQPCDIHKCDEDVCPEGCTLHGCDWIACEDDCTLHKHDTEKCSFYCMKHHTDACYKDTGHGYKIEVCEHISHDCTVSTHGCDTDCIGNYHSSSCYNKCKSHHGTTCYTYVGAYGGRYLLTCTHKCDSDCNGNTHTFDCYSRNRKYHTGCSYYNIPSTTLYVLTCKHICDDYVCPDDCDISSHICDKEKCTYPCYKHNCDHSVCSDHCDKPEHQCDNEVCTEPHHPTTLCWFGVKEEYCFEEVKDDFVAEMNAYNKAVADREEWERECAPITEYNARIENGAQNARLCAYEFYKNWLGANIALEEHLANAGYYYSKMMIDSKPAEPYLGTLPEEEEEEDLETGEANKATGWKPNDTAGTNLLALLNRELTNMQLHDMRVEASKNTCGVGTFDNSSIASSAVSWAWPQGYPEYCDVDDTSTLTDGGVYWQTKCTSLYIAVKNIVAPADITYYSSCDRGAATAIRASGSDDDFPMGACIQQRDYMDAHPDKWMCVGELNSVGKDALEPGDILVEDHHIVVFVGGEAAAEKWPDLYTADSAKYGIVHSSIGTTLDDSRGPRFDIDMDWMIGRSYKVYRCINTDIESSHIKQEIDGQIGALSTLHDGSFVP